MAEMSTQSGRVWLHHPTTDAYFQCPTAAAEDWQQRGWQPSDPPPAPPNPVVAERIAWQRDQQARSDAEAADKPHAEVKRQSAAPTTPKEK